MNKSESKYFNTAKKMDKAFLELLDKKDLEYITVREICKNAQVNRSTFYLHYETIDDLLNECLEFITNSFLDYYKDFDQKKVVDKIYDDNVKDLFLITPEYLKPFLLYIKEHKKLYSTCVKKYHVLKMDNAYNNLYKYIINPIMDKFNVPKDKRTYLNVFYLEGIMAAIKTWIENDCNDSIDFISNLIIDCIVPDTLK